MGDLNFAVIWSAEFPRKRGEENGRIVSLWMQKQEWTKEERERKSISHTSYLYNYTNAYIFLYFQALRYFYKAEEGENCFMFSVSLLASLVVGVLPLSFN